MHDKPDRVRRMNLWRLYRMRPEEYDALREKQGYRCAACNRHEDELPQLFLGRKRNDGTQTPTVKLQVDHGHSCCPSQTMTCGKCVRGLLCHDCNHTVARSHDDIDRLEAIVRYLRAHPPVA